MRFILNAILTWLMRLLKLNWRNVVSLQKPWFNEKDNDMQWVKRVSTDGIFFLPCPYICNCSASTSSFNFLFFFFFVSFFFGVTTRVRTWAGNGSLPGLRPLWAPEFWTHATECGWTPDPKKISFREIWADSTGQHNGRQSLQKSTNKNLCRYTFKLFHLYKLRL